MRYVSRARIDRIVEILQSRGPSGRLAVAEAMGARPDEAGEWLSELARREVISWRPRPGARGREFYFVPKTPD